MYKAFKLLVRGRLTKSKLSMSTLTSTSKYAALPKVELHVHADGSCRVSTLQELSRQYGLPYPHDNLEEFKEVVSLTTAAPSLAIFLSKFDAVLNILRTKESLERIAYEFCEDSAKENVVYSEYRFSPFSNVPGVCAGEDYCEGIFAGLSRGQRDFNLKVRCILVIMRNIPEHAMDVVKLAAKYRGDYVVGVDIAGDELLPLDPRHVEGFQKAKELGLHVTVHAAESGPASNVREAVERMGAERIGHGYHVLDEQEVYQFAKDKRLHFEGCPTSSVYTSSNTFEDHALQAFARDGVSFSLNTDDPGIIHCSLTNEYDVTESRIGLTQHQIMRSVLCGAEAAFLPPDEKDELVKTIKEKLALFDPTFKF